MRVYKCVVRQRVYDKCVVPHVCAVRREENDVSLHARWAVPMAVRAFWAVIGSKMQAHAPLSDSRSNAKIFLFSTMQNHTPFSDSRSSVKLFYDNAKSCSYTCTCACTIVLRPIQSHSVSTIMSTAILKVQCIVGTRYNHAISISTYFTMYKAFAHPNS